MFVEDIEIRPDRSDIGEIFLHKTIIVRGEAIDEETGMPVNGAEVGVGTSSEHFVSTTSDSTGRFRVNITKPGEAAAGKNQALVLEIGLAGAYGARATQVNASQTDGTGVVDVGRIVLQRQREVTDE